MRDKNYTIIISGFKNPEYFNLLAVHVSIDATTADNFIETIKSSLTTIKKGLDSINLIITDAATYNLFVFKKLQTLSPEIQFITRFSRLLKNIVTRIPKAYDDLLNFSSR